MADTVIEPQGDAAATKAADDAGKTNKAADTPRTYTDAEVNAIVGREKKKAQDQYAKQLDELEELRKTQGISKQQQEKLAARIADTEALLSEETKAKRDAEKKNREAALALETERKAAGQYKSLYETTVIENAILAAANAPGQEAYNPNQLLAIVKPLVALEEVKDSRGRAIHKAVVKVTVKEDGEEVEKSIPVTEYVKEMSTREEFANLFKSNVKGGSGFRPAGAAGGGKRVVTNADLIAGKVDPADVLKGNVIVKD